MPNGSADLWFARINPLIERDQLGPHLRQLVKAEFLASYTITDAKGRDGFVITFRPGSAFFADYDRFYRRREQGSIQFDFHADRQQIAEPLKVAYLFVEKRNGHASAGIPYVPSKDVETAKYLLARVPFEDISDFLDYALAEAKKTRFDVQTLGGLKQYLSRYQERRACSGPLQRQPRLGARPRTRPPSGAWITTASDERRLTGCLQACRPRSRQRSRLPHAPRRPAMRGGRGSLAQTMFEIERARITVERHPGKIPSFDQWKARRRNQ